MSNIRYGFVQAFEYKGIRFWGGDIDEVIISGPFDLVIALSDKSLPKIDASVPETFKAFAASIVEPDLLRINWKGDLPLLPVTCWEALVKDIDENANLFQDVAVCCFDGTSKTGVGLAILKALLLKQGGDPIQSIRDSYSPKAVHYDEQIDYITYITGLESTCEGSKEKKKKP